VVIADPLCSGVRSRHWAGGARGGKDRARNANEYPQIVSNEYRLLKKAHLFRCAQSPRFNAATSTPPLADFSRASQLTF
jgi:hypothetical protein